MKRYIKIGKVSLTLLTPVPISLSEIHCHALPPPPPPTRAFALFSCSAMVNLSVSSVPCLSNDKSWSPYIYHRKVTFRMFQQGSGIWASPPPPPPLECTRKLHACSHFLGNGDFFFFFFFFFGGGGGGVFRGKIFQRNILKGMLFKSISRDMGYISEASREIKRGIYAYTFPEHSIASRKMGVGPLLYCISVIGPLECNVICFLSYSWSPKKRKQNKTKGMGVTYNGP